MRTLRVILAGSLAAALLATALAVPATAAPSKGKLAIVQGWYGLKVDVCVNGKEVASKMRFGQVVQRKLGSAPKLVKVFKADPRPCKGVKLAKTSFKFPLGSDLTMVVGKWKKPSRILVFDNAPPPGLVEPFASYLVFRHAADFGKVTFRHVLGNLPDDMIKPAAVSPDMFWRRGDEAWRKHVLLAGGLVPFATTWVGQELPHWPTTIDVAGPRLTRIGGHERYEFIFIGRSNHTRLLVLKRG